MQLPEVLVRQDVGRLAAHELDLNCSKYVVWSPGGKGFTNSATLIITIIEIITSTVFAIRDSAVAAGVALDRDGVV